MLVQYAVENYKSIKEEVVINFRADKKYSDSEWVIKSENSSVSLYKCIGLIGPNASGKSNILESLHFAFRFILNTINRKASSEINRIPFAFGDDMQEKPTVFEFIFYQKGIKYIYGFSIDNQEVQEEYLLGYYSVKPKTLFERSKGQNYEFKGNDVKSQKEIAKKTNPNRLYMPVAAEWGYEPLKMVYQWFEFQTRQSLEWKFGVDFVSNIIHEIVRDRKRKKVFIEELQKADFNIVDVYVLKKKLSPRSQDFLEKIFKELVGDIMDVSVPEDKFEIRVVHENQNGEQFDIALKEDSAGTERILKSVSEFLYICQHGGLMLEDELGKSYHTMLTQHFLQMVKSSSVNFGNAQLFFTTHQTKVLKVLNPDQVYLVDKDETGATVVKLLDNYVIRENDNIELGYLKGRYGSVPYMRG